MARKPLLSGPVLNREDVQSRLAGEDVMSRIISNDREKNGRTTPASAEERESSNEVSIIPSNEEVKLHSNDGIIIPSSEDSNTPSPQQTITPSIDQTLTPSSPLSSEGSGTPVSVQPNIPMGTSPTSADEASTWTQSMREALDAQIKAHLMQQMMAQNEKGPVTRLNVEMAEDLHLRLKQNCVIKRRPIKAVINALIAFYLEQEEK